MATTDEIGGSIAYLNNLRGKEVYIEFTNGKPSSLTGELMAVFEDSIVVKLTTGTQLVYTHAICSVRDSSHNNLKPAQVGPKLF